MSAKYSNEEYTSDASPVWSQKRRSLKVKSSVYGDFCSTSDSLMNLNVSNNSINQSSCSSNSPSSRRRHSVGVVSISFGGNVIRDFPYSLATTWEDIVTDMIQEMHLCPNHDWAVCREIRGKPAEPLMLWSTKVGKTNDFFSSGSMDSQEHTSSIYICRQAFLPRMVTLDLMTVESRLIYAQCARNFRVSPLWEDAEQVIKCAAAMVKFDSPRYGKLVENLEDKGAIESIIPGRLMMEKCHNRNWWINHLRWEMERQPKKDSINALMNYAFWNFKHLRSFGQRLYLVKHVKDVDQNSTSVPDTVFKETRKYWQEEFSTDYSKMVEDHFPIGPSQTPIWVLGINSHSLTLYNSDCELYERSFSCDLASGDEHVVLWGAREGCLQLIVNIYWDQPGQSEGCLVPMRINLKFSAAMEVNGILDHFWRGSSPNNSGQS